MFLLFLFRWSLFIMFIFRWSLSPLKRISVGEHDLALHKITKN
jgi:hypothetical protein